MDQEELNLKHIENPELGDYWHERFSGVCVVLKVTEDTVTISRKKVDVDEDHWTFILEEAETLSLKEFKEFLTYASNRSKCWADVFPRKLVALAETYLNLETTDGD